MAEKVDHFIMCTASHMTTQNPSTDLAFFLDFDLSILGTEGSEYERYAQAIREEYSHVEEQVFRTKRPEVLKTFLQTKTLYFTEECKELFEENARRNLANEIKSLESK